MKTKYVFIKRIKMAWWALFNSSVKNMITEQCEKCKSVNIEVGAHYTEKQEDGKIFYYAKYFCRRCGATCITQEIWEDDGLLEPNKIKTEE